MEYFLIKGIEQAKCKVCKECIKECPQRLFFLDKNKIVFNDPYLRCIKCGHCLAVCPRSAVLFNSMEKPLKDSRLKNPTKIIDTENLHLFLRARRSIRRYKKTKIADYDIEKILQAMRYAPTASNRELLHFSVIQGKYKELFAKKVMALFKKIYLLLKIIRFLIFWVRKKTYGIFSAKIFFSLKMFFELIAKGEDPVFWGAPVIIILSAPPYHHQAEIDAGIALTYGMLTAQSLGLGTCLIGFAHETLVRSRKLRKLFKIPKSYRPLGVIALGKPSVKYLQAPPRKPVSVTFLKN